MFQNELILIYSIINTAIYIIYSMIKKIIIKIKK